MVRTKLSHHRTQGYPDSSKRLWTFRWIGKTIPECSALLDFYGSISSHNEYINGNINQDMLDEGKESFQAWLDEADEDYILVKLLELRQSSVAAFADACNMVDATYKRYFVRRDTIPKVMGDVICFYAASKKEGNYKVIEKPIVFKNKKGDIQVTMTGCYPYARDYETIFAFAGLMDDKGFTLLVNGMLYFNATLTEICTKMGRKNPSSQTSHNFVLRSIKRLTECNISWERKDSKGKWRLLHMGHILAEATTLKPETSNNELGISFGLSFLRLFDFGYLRATKVIHELTEEENLLYVYALTHNFDGMFGGKHGYYMVTIYDNAMRGFGTMPKSDAYKSRKIERLIKRLKSKGVISRIKIDNDNRVKFNIKLQSEQGHAPAQPLLRQHEEVKPKTFYRRHKQPKVERASIRRKRESDFSSLSQAMRPSSSKREVTEDEYWESADI